MSFICNSVHERDKASGRLTSIEMLRWGLRRSITVGVVSWGTIMKASGDATGPPVAIITRNRLLCEGVAHALDARYGLTAFDAFADLPGHRQDIVLFDLATPGDALALFEWTAGRNDAPPILALIAAESKTTLPPLLANGRLSAVRTDISPEGLNAAVRAALAGLTVFDPTFATFPTADGALRDVDAEGPVDSDAESTAWNLSPREWAVLELLARGMSNKEIGRALSITDGTVRVHMREVLRKLDVTNRTQAALMFVRTGK